MQFSTLGGSKVEIFKTDFFDFLTIHNDQISYVNHVLDPLYVFFSHERMLQLMRLATQCRDTWARRLRAPARIRPPLLPYARGPPWAPSKSVPLTAPQRSRPPGASSGT